MHCMESLPDCTKYSSECTPLLGEDSELASFRISEALKIKVAEAKRCKKGNQVQYMSEVHKGCREARESRSFTDNRKAEQNTAFV